MNQIDFDWNKKKPTNEKSIPFGKNVRVVITKGNIPGIIIGEKGPKTWEVKHKDTAQGIVVGVFKSRQMRRPRDESEYFLDEET